MSVPRRTRVVHVRDLRIGANNPISVQSMCATRTQDLKATLSQIKTLEKSGADLIRIAIDSRKDADMLPKIRAKTNARLVVDLQENYPLIHVVAKHVDKVRYNPGHLHHLNKSTSIKTKVREIIDTAKKEKLAVRIGVNCGSIAPFFLKKYPKDPVQAIVQSAVSHCELLDDMDFDNYVVSLKDSDPWKVIACNESFSKLMPNVPVHLGVTEAGLPPDGIVKTRIAFEKLIAQGIGDTVRVSLTLPHNRKEEEILVGKKILSDIANKRFITVPENYGKGLNIISCPSCSRVENEKFVELAEEVKRLSRYAEKHAITIAVMGCRVNGPGETDDADLGLWCGPSTVTFKQKTRVLGSYSYSSILPALKTELDILVGERQAGLAVSS